MQTGLVDQYYYNIIHFVFCLSADEEEEVEKMCQSVISQMERTLGEPLQKYFWLSRRMYLTGKCCKPENVALRDYKKWINFTSQSCFVFYYKWVFDSCSGMVDVL